jgi:hypothetical protein
MTSLARRLLLTRPVHGGIAMPKLIVVAFSLLVSLVALARTAPAVAADTKKDIRVLGRLNINDATREQLMTVPGLDRELVDAIVSARQKAPIADLATLPIPPLATQHLKTDGSSDYRRIRVLPLQVMVTPTTTAAR